MLVGQQRAGKDTIADYLEILYDFKRFNLAKGIYELAYQYFDMKKKDRELLIKIGKQMRGIDPDVFIKYTLKEIEKYMAVYKWVKKTYETEINKNIVITDVRLKREYKTLNENGFISVYVYADKEIRSKREGYNPEADVDATETELTISNINYDYIINNEGTKEELKEAIKELIKKIENNLNVSV